MKHRALATIVSLATPVVAGGIAFSAPGVAQAAETSISGVVRNKKTKGPLRDALVIIQCTCMQGEKSTTTNDRGLYVFRDLPPGKYTIQVFKGKSDITKVVDLPRNTPFRANFSLDPEEDEIRRILVEVPIPPETKIATTIPADVAAKIPLGSGRDDKDMVLADPSTSVGAGGGIRVGGTDVTDTRWTVEGADVTNPSFGTPGASIVQEFLESVEVVSGGYDAEFGNASGGQINARRISGSNKVRGIARFTFTPRLAKPRFVLQTDEALRVTQVPDYAMEGVVSASGPIVEDKLFWSAGITMGGTKYSLIQQFYHRLDKDGSGGFEGCPYKNGDNDCVEGGNYIASKKFAEQKFTTRGISMGFVGGLDWAINPKHRVQLTAIGGPGFSNRSYRLPFAASPNAFGGNPTADPGGGTTSATGVVNKHFGWDRGNQFTISLGYLGRVAKDKIEVDATIAYSQFTGQEAWKLENPEFRSLPATQEQDNQGDNLFEFLDRDKAVNLVEGVEDACNSADIPGTACPARRWLSGGIGQFGRDTSRRVQGRFSLTHFLNSKRAGSHQLKYGAEIQHLQRDTHTQYSGSNLSDFYDNCPAGQKDLGETCYNPATDSYDFDLGNRVNNHRFVVVNVNNPDQRSTNGFGRIRHEQNDLRAIATPLGAGMRADGYDARLSTQNYSVYLQDKWAVLSNLYINAGVRWEIQDMRNVLGDRAVLVWDNVAPRIGAVYDWTGEGRSRLFASYGWFYQPLPLQLGSRIFGGLVQVGRTYQNSDCEGKTVNINGTEQAKTDRGQPTEFCTDFPSFTTGLTKGAVVPRLKGMYRQQLNFGYQQEIIEDLLFRVSWLHTDLGRAVEDVSTNGGLNFIVANPGEKISDKDIRAQSDECATLADSLASLPMDDDGRNVVARELQQCEFLADAYERINSLFDRPTQNFDSFTFELQKRFGGNWVVLGSYTYSRLIGNYSGFVDPNTGAVTLGVDPQYDIPELVRNSFGPLPFDQRHRARLNGFYTFNLREAGRLTLGTSFNFQSGYPVSLRADNNRYAGAFLINVLPRGSAGRVEPNYQWNVSMGYVYPLHKDLELELSARVLNVTNAKAVLRVDEVYSFQATRPVAGGDLGDLKHTKIQSSGNPTEFFQRTILAPQGNFGVESQFQTPLSAQFDVQLRF